MLPFFQLELARTVEIYGDDFWPYGVERNKSTLEAARRYSYEQGLSVREVSVDELFPKSVTDAYID